MLRRFSLSEQTVRRDFHKGLHRAIAVRAIGADADFKGLFTAAPLEAETVVWFGLLQRLVTRAELAAMSEAERLWACRHGYQADANRMSVPLAQDPDDPDFDQGYYFNHACAPNTLMCEVALPDGTVLLGQYAPQALAAGVELTYAYHTTETGLDDQTRFVCQCGAPDCVGVYETRDVTQQKAMLEGLARRFGPDGVMPHVEDFILAAFPNAALGRNLRPSGKTRRRVA